MTRRYGRGPAAERLVVSVPHDHWRTITLVAGLRSSGVTAPLALDGPLIGAGFVVYVEQMLTPTLALTPQVWYLPPYSPDLNPTGVTRLTCHWKVAEASSFSPSSRRCCSRPPSAPSTGSNVPSANYSTCSRLSNAATISLTPAIQAQRKNAVVLWKVN